MAEPWRKSTIALQRLLVAHDVANELSGILGDLMRRPAF